MKIALIVEDSLTDREYMARSLSSAGFSVISTSSVEEAKDRLAKQSPNIIFLDVILPGQSGFEFCRELKGSPDTQKIPVVICSTKGTEVDKTWGTMLGADDYLAKPVELKTLQQTLIRLGLA